MPTKFAQRTKLERDVLQPLQLFLKDGAFYIHFSIIATLFTIVKLLQYVS